MKLSLTRLSISSNEDGTETGINARVSLDFPGATENVAGFIDIFFEHPEANKLTYEDAESLITEKVRAYLSA